MKGHTAGSDSRPQLTSRHTDTFLSTAERFRASSITGQYLQNQSHTSIRARPDQESTQAHSPVVMKELGRGVILHDRHMNEELSSSDDRQDRVQVSSTRVRTEARRRRLRKSRALFPLFDQKYRTND